MPGGLFFEIVERCDGDRGYGTTNTPTRLAARSRLTNRQFRRSPRRVDAIIQQEFGLRFGCRQRTV
jgi:hypothetical protein